MPATIPEHLKLSYVYDPSIDDALDRELRGLLCISFPGPMFQHKRYNSELPAHRWILREPQGGLIAHLAVHDKRIGLPAGEVRVAGVAEVCVHPDQRGRGLASALHRHAIAWMRDKEFAFSILLGLPEVYGGLGYRAVSNPIHFFDLHSRSWVTRPSGHFLVLGLGQSPWPDEGVVDLRSPLF